MQASGNETGHSGVAGDQNGALWLIAPASTQPWEGTNDGQANGPDWPYGNPRGGNKEFAFRGGGGQ